MDKNTLANAKLLGELYRTQKRIDPSTCPVSDDVIYGLLNGIERVIEDEFNVSLISKEDEEIVVSILNEYFVDAEKLNQLKGYYDIEHRLENQGIERWKAIKIITLLQAEDRFTNVIAKLNSSHSPVECKTFKIPDWNK